MSNVIINVCLLIENGFVQKAVNYAGEMFIIEEIQLFENPEPISILRLSSTKVVYVQCGWIKKPPIVLSEGSISQDRQKCNRCCTYITIYKVI